MAGIGGRRAADRPAHRRRDRHGGAAGRLLRRCSPQRAGLPGGGRDLARRRRRSRSWRRSPWRSGSGRRAGGAARRRGRPPSTSRTPPELQAPSASLRNRTCSSRRFSATTSCGVMCVTPESGSTLCGRPAASSADGQPQGVRDHDVVVGEAVHEQQRPLQLLGVGEQGGARVRLRVRVGATEVALRVVGVVERPVRDGRARRPRRGTRPGGAARPTRRGTRRTTSRGCRPATGRGRGAAAATACSASTWSSRTGAARSPWTARSNSGPSPGVPRPSTTTTAKPCSANHWLVRWALRAATTRWACGPP